MKKLLVGLAILATLAWIFFRLGPAPEPPDGRRLAFVPEQKETFAPDWTAGEFSVHPLARYRIQARVLSKKRYYLEETSGIAPYDLALGWGDMSDSAVLKHFSISQGGRWFEYTYDATCPIPPDAITRQCANVHCLPASDGVRRDLSRLRVNAFVELRGYLVEVKHPSAPNSWRSSLVRDDDGAGACEILWVTDLTVLP